MTAFKSVLLKNPTCAGGEQSWTYFPEVDMTVESLYSYYFGWTTYKVRHGKEEVGRTITTTRSVRSDQEAIVEALRWLAAKYRPLQMQEWNGEQWVPVGDCPPECPPDCPDTGAIRR